MQVNSKEEKIGVIRKFFNSVTAVLNTLEERALRMIVKGIFTVILFKICATSLLIANASHLAAGIVLTTGFWFICVGSVVVTLIISLAIWLHDT